MQISTPVAPAQVAQVASKGAKAIGDAIVRIYVEGGIRGFWVGNGLSVAKIFPESAIKFFSYETSVCGYTTSCSVNKLIRCCRNAFSLSMSIWWMIRETLAERVDLSLAVSAG